MISSYSEFRWKIFKMYINLACFFKVAPIQKLIKEVTLTFSLLLLSFHKWIYVYVFKTYHCYLSFFLLYLSHIESPHWSRNSQTAYISITYDVTTECLAFLPLYSANGGLKFQKLLNLTEVSGGFLQFPGTFWGRRPTSKKVMILSTCFPPPYS
jgi:hypothetical protein